ncbi:polysaccharide biosynthesis tyrosine autokinase [Pseudoprevotella muciniphila]|uniref:non-specific protein-tyrosine kinase n=1 Tax=Pseudoprevotella muciniphila TaxID=2133944 RepID=A0A5P8E5Z0_9BACT|nr:tyrosine-protein kinase [Pseudoprevotella muciniphila]QFQ12344.1 polysaccharide biosynthesis tyrosine autokinase [Pseudoprevotella muciniphila]
MATTENKDKELGYKSDNPTPEDEKRYIGVDLQQLIGHLIANWFWILLCAAIALIIAWLYLKKTPTTYQVQSSVLIKGEDNVGMRDQGTLTARSQFSSVFSSANNFSTEMDIIGSRTLIKKVLEDLDLYITLRRTDTYQERDLWGEAPIKVWMTPQEAEKAEHISMKMNLHKNGSIDIHGIDASTGKSSLKRYNKLPVIIHTKNGVVSITRVDSVPIKENMEISASIVAPTRMASSYKGRLSISQTNKESFITSLTMNDTRPERSILFIKKLVEAYNSDANEDKNQIAQRTDEFINNRIVLISSELGNTEDRLAKFKKQAGLTDLNSDNKEALQGRSQYETQLADNATQLNLITYLHDYVKQNRTKNDVIPTSVGIKNDNGVMAMINKYNEAVIERNRLAKGATAKNSVIANADVALQDMRNNIERTLAGLADGARIAQEEIQAKLDQFQGKIEETPEGEKQFLSISRERDFQSQLYLLLLQKREENAIKLAATANNGRIIEEPETTRPVAPKRMMIMIVALIIGLTIPILVIYLKLLFSVKIAGREDIAKFTNLPVIGDIPFDKSGEGERHVSVQNNSNSMMDEAFRNLRTNIQFMLHDTDKKVLMCTSAIAGEGKSTVAGNLAASYAFLDKKVVIVGLDIRKPGLNKVFKLSTRAYGISQFLANPEEEDLMSLVQQSDVSPNLFILPGGIVPPNPTELLSQKSLEKAIDILKENFDLVILDTAPVGLVSDSQVISRVADMSICVVRENFSYKSSLFMFDDMARDKVLPNVGLVLNAVKQDGHKRYGRYGYGYGYGRHYGYGYGQYGYGYGQQESSKKKKGLKGLFKSFF